MDYEDEQAAGYPEQTHDHAQADDGGHMYNTVYWPQIVGAHATRSTLIAQYLRSAKEAISTQWEISRQAWRYSKHPIAQLLSARDAVAGLGHSAQGIAYQLLEVPLLRASQIEHAVVRNFRIAQAAPILGQLLGHDTDSPNRPEPQEVITLPRRFSDPPRSSQLAQVREQPVRIHGQRWLLLALGAVVIGGGSVIVWHQLASERHSGTPSTARRLWAWPSL